MKLSEMHEQARTYSAPAEDPATGREAGSIFETLALAALIIVGLGAGLFGLALASDGYHPGAAKLILAGLAALVFAVVWIWKSRRKIASAASSAALDTAAIGLRAGRAVGSRAENIAAEIKRRADR